MTPRTLVSHARQFCFRDEQMLKKAENYLSKPKFEGDQLVLDAGTTFVVGFLSNIESIRISRYRLNIISQ